LVYLFLRAAFLAGDAGRGALIASAGAPAASPGALGAGGLILPNEPTETNGKAYEGHEKMEPPPQLLLSTFHCSQRRTFQLCVKAASKGQFSQDLLANCTP